MGAPVLLDVDGGIARVRLNRPAQSNALDLPLLRRLTEVLLALQSRPDLRVVLLGGAGRNFCGGGDVADFAARGEALPDHLREVTAYLQAAVAALLRLPVPVVAAVQGWATGGGGFGLVCAADLVVAGEGTRLMLGATRVGMAPDAGLSVVLPRIVGLRRAMEIALLNPVIDAPQALALGLVTRVVADEALAAEADELARELASGPTRALAETKRLLWAGVGASVESCLGDEARTVAALSGTADAREGLAAVIERRAPRYAGR
jgi:2-(1,2-epoxy-1,2-dihydrophenyl)acetyl-CoA isomerase